MDRNIVGVLLATLVAKDASRVGNDVPCDACEETDDVLLRDIEKIEKSQELLNEEWPVAFTIHTKSGKKFEVLVHEKTDF